MKDPNIDLFRALKDGRRKFREVAQDLGLAENTVRARYRKLKESGVLEVTALVDPEKLESHQTALVGMKVKSADLVNAGKRIASLKGVVNVRVVTGRYDLMVDVLLKEGFGLLEFFTQEVAKVEDVQDFETFVVYKSFGHKVPYVL
ncbi:MAG: Lrp/AsnC family transcriptional regulator [Spirochaetaceae bacterium]|nr:Lrp/AsnC family transcriptional regulator [Spirochaetaceae bacterium]MDT8297660.1 Lrp/AsnC family transcriptional regulator [Spirochaetaceae bacterium]